MNALQTIFWLGTKELRSFFRDTVMLVFVVYSFSFAVIAQAQSNSQELNDASIAIVDEDRSALSRQLAGAFLPPFFKPPQGLALPDIDRAMDAGQYTFVVDIPPYFERDVLGGRQPTLLVAIDATAMVQAGLGSGTIQTIVTAEIARFLSHDEGLSLSGPVGTTPTPVTLVVRLMFNPNATPGWFMAVMGIVNNVTMLAIILAGAAIVREREHGTMEHLLVMPVTPFQIAMSKLWANGLVITVAVGLSLAIVVRALLGIPLAGSVPLFLLGVAAYLFFSLSVGIFLGTVARSMPQLGLLYVLVAVPLSLLSGSNTPVQSMPPLLRTLMSLSPATHFVSFAQSILFRGAGIDIVWLPFAEVALAGGLFLVLAVFRFRAVAAQAA